MVQLRDMSASVKKEDSSQNRWTRRSVLHLVGASLALGGARAARAQVATPVVYPNLNGHGVDNLGYRVLELALQRSGKP